MEEVKEYYKTVLWDITENGGENLYNNKKENRNIVVKFYKDKKIIKKSLGYLTKL